MFKIIESVCDKPTRFMCDPTVFEPGLAVQLIEINGTPTCTLSDGTRPLGLVDHVDEFGLAHIWYDTMVVQTNKYDQFESYSIGDSLYISRFSVLTNKKPYDSSILVGHVIVPPNSQKDYLELNWL